MDAVRHGARVLRSGDDLAPRMLWFADLSVMFSLDPLAALVAKRVDLEAVRQSRRRLRVSTANWVTGRVEVRDGSTLGEGGHNHIVAAAARPGIFPSVEIDGAAEVEATAFANSDLSAAVEAGASHLHVPVFLSTRAEEDRPASTIDAFDRLLAELQLARLDRELSELRARRPRGMTVHVYRGSLGPSESHGFLDLRRNRIEALFEHGRGSDLTTNVEEPAALTATARRPDPSTPSGECYGVRVDASRRLRSPNKCQEGTA
jgi:predicted acylesterase/phospholipase RssA